MSFILVSDHTSKMYLANNDGTNSGKGRNCYSRTSSTLFDLMLDDIDAQLVASVDVMDLTQSHRVIFN
jgi:hypothetical protein